MLGELLGEEIGKTIGIRVLGTENGNPKIESSFESHGSILGVESQTIGTYEAVSFPDQTLHGFGQGFTSTVDGAVLNWTARGRGNMSEDGAASWRGSLYYETSSAAYERFNTIIGVFEFETGSDGSTHAKVWEWK